MLPVVTRPQNPRLGFRQRSPFEKFATVFPISIGESDPQVVGQ